jgi:hypothetical protein
MGVSMEGILSMAEMARGCSAMRVRTAQHKSDSDRHKKEVKCLEKELEAERVCVTRANTEVDRMKREGGRHALIENQVEEWREKAEDYKAKAEKVRYASKTAVQKALKERERQGEERQERVCARVSEEHGVWRCADALHGERKRRIIHAKKPDARAAEGVGGSARGELERDRRVEGKVATGSADDARNKRQFITDGIPRGCS